MQAGTVDPKELEISPEMQAKRDKIDVKNLGIGLFVSNSFFAWGFIVAKIWSKFVPSVSIHAYSKAKFLCPMLAFLIQHHP